MRSCMKTNIFLQEILFLKQWLLLCKFDNVCRVRLGNVQNTTKLFSSLLTETKHHYVKTLDVKIIKIINIIYFKLTLQ